MWPPVKKKAIDAHPSFAAFLGNSGANIASGEPKTAAPKAKVPGRKRKVDAEVDGENETKSAGPKSATVEKSDSAGDKVKVEVKKKAAPAKKPAKRVKKEVKSEVKSEEDDSADGGDGLGEYKFHGNVLCWLRRADQGPGGAQETAEDEQDEI